MDDKKFNMLFSSNHYFGYKELQKLTQSVVFLSDTVMISNTLQIDPNLSEKENKFIYNRVNLLRELGAIRVFGIENLSSILRDNNLPIVFPENADVIIDTRSYTDIYNEVLQNIIDQRSRLFGERAQTYDGVTEVVIGKQELFKFAIGEFLDADRWLLDEVNLRNMDHFFRDLLRYEEFEGPILEEVIEQLKIPDLNLLDEQSLAKCRTYMPIFRQKLIMNSQRGNNDFFREKVIAKIANEITSEFNDALLKSHKERSGLFPTLGEEVFWDIMQSTFPPAIFAKYLKKLFEFRLKKTNAPDPLLFNLKIAQK